VVHVDEMMSIGQFSKATGLSISALRFYAARDVLEPAAVDPGSNYRRYADAQIDAGRLIRDLRRLEMPLDMIRHALTSSQSEREQLIRDHLFRLDQMVHRAHSVAQSLGALAPEMDPQMTTPTPTAGSVATIRTADLAAALSQVLPAVGSDPEQPHHMVVLIEGKEGSLRFVGTDRHRLAIRDLVPASLHREFSVVVAAAALRRWQVTLAACETDATTALVLGDVIRLVANDVELDAAMVPTSFPDYEPLLETAATATSVVVQRSPLESALASFSGTQPIQLVATEEQFSIVRDDTVVDVPARCSGGPAHVGIDPRYVRDAIRSAVGPEIVVEIGECARPVVFRSADDGTFLTLVMPVKLD